MMSNMLVIKIPYVLMGLFQWWYYIFKYDSTIALGSPKALVAMAALKKKASYFDYFLFSCQVSKDGNWFKIHPQLYWTVSLSIISLIFFPLAW